MISYKKVLVSAALAMLFFIGSGLINEVYAGSNDNGLNDRVTAAITSRYDPSNVEVTVKDGGWVMLNGEVNTLYDKDRIYEIASHIHGVTRITNDINVVPRRTTEIKNTTNIPSDIIEHDVRMLMDKNAAITEPDNINIAVDGSLVILSGHVNFYREKILARTVASQVRGVTAIQNDIKITPINQAIDDQNLKEVFESILHDEFPLVDQNQININVQNGFVTISGTVSNLWVKNNMAKEFASVEGVIDVINKLEVKPEMNG